MGRRRCDTEIDSDVLKRIVALLVSLAVLAEHAAGISARSRGQVLGILMWGEAEARHFIFGLAIGGVAFSGTQAPAEAFAVSDDVPVSSRDAAHCAVRLRALALVLCMLLAGALTHAASGSRTAAENPVAGIATPRRAAFPAPDTS